MKELPKCLLVDDLSQNLISLAGLLNEVEVEIHTAQSANEALELLLENDYAFALIDVQMPGMNGFELAELMRTRNRTKHVPIIFVTAADQDFNRIFKGYEAGAVDFLHKPLYPEIVLGKVRVFLELYNQRKLLKETFERDKTELEQKVQARTEALRIAKNEMEAFSYSVSHDLRAPLRSMDGFSKALLDIYGEKLDDRGKDYLRRIRESSQKMGELIDALLALSNIGRNEIKYQKIDISKISNEIISNLKKIHPERIVETKIAEGLEVTGDPVLLFTLLENLIGNAWKYSARKEKALIEIGEIIEDERKVILVRDNGAGFDMKYSDKLFRPFQRLHLPADFEGTGIGLATALRIIDRHNGKIWATSEPGKETTFYFYTGKGEIK